MLKRVIAVCIAVSTQLSAADSPVVAIASGYGHNVALRADGTVVAWGLSGTSAQTGVPAGLKAKAVAAGENHSVAVKLDGTVVQWGTVSGGKPVPAKLTNVVAVAAGRYHTLALSADGSLVAWGENGSGQCTIPSGITGTAYQPAECRPVRTSDNSLVSFPSHGMRGVFDVGGRTVLGAFLARGVASRVVCVVGRELRVDVEQ